MKQKYSREEIIDLLKRNVTHFKDDEVFVQYMIDMATFLVEYRLYKQQQGTLTPTPGPEKRMWLSQTQDRDVELERVLRKHATQRQPGSKCRMCGSVTGGALSCPRCGHMTI